MKAYVFIGICAAISCACAGGLLVGMQVSIRLFAFSCAHEPQWFRTTMKRLSTGLLYSAIVGVVSFMLIALKA